MRTSSPFAVLLSTFARAETLNWVFANVAWCDHWNSIIRAPCLEELESIAENNPLTILVPNSDAAKKFKQSPEFSSYTNDSICDLVKYHTIVGGYSADAITGAGPFLQTFLGKSNSQDGHSLQVDGDKTDRRGRGINFYSGLRRKASIWYGDYTQADGIFLHAIDEVLTPPLSFADTAHAAGLTSAIMAATKVNLDWWTDYPATYFVPNNEAFQNVGNMMNGASDDELRSILAYHYLNRTRTPIWTSTMYNGTVATANGEHVWIARSEDGIFSINSATMTQHNIIVQNGVLHIIDQVLNPDNAKSQQNNPSPFGMSAFPNATRSTKPPFADMLTRKSKYHLEAGQGRAAIPFGQSWQ